MLRNENFPHVRIQTLAIKMLLGYRNCEKKREREKKNTSNRFSVGNWERKTSEMPMHVRKHTHTHNEGEIEWHRVLHGWKHWKSQALMSTDSLKTVCSHLSEWFSFLFAHSAIRLVFAFTFSVIRSISAWNKISSRILCAEDTRKSHRQWSFYLDWKIYQTQWFVPNIE